MVPCPTGKRKLDMRSQQLLVKETVRQIIGTMDLDGTPVLSLANGDQLVRYEGWWRRAITLFQTQLGKSQQRYELYSIPCLYAIVWSKTAVHTLHCVTGQGSSWQK